MMRSFRSRRIETVSDDTDLEEVYNTERHLLEGLASASEFLDVAAG